jgi:hypothetical protein
MKFQHVDNLKIIFHRNRLKYAFNILPRLLLYKQYQGPTQQIVISLMARYYLRKNLRVDVNKSGKSSLKLRAKGGVVVTVVVATPFLAETILY